MDWAEACRILGVEETSSPSEIKAQWFYKANILHPDKTLNLSEAMRAKAEQEFKRVSEAYEYLSNTGNNPFSRLSKLDVKTKQVHFKDIKNIKRWLFLAIFLFIFGLVWGLLTPADAPGLLTEDIAALEGLSDFLLALPQIAVFILIFLKNVVALLVSFALSPFFCLMPVFALVINGGLLGQVSAIVVQEKSLIYLLAGILPHGIIELPALFIGEAAAFSFGTAVILAVFSREKRNLLLPNLKQNTKYLAIAIILLFPAALIETYVTPLLVK